jgi:hypothetical protein
MTTRINVLVNDQTVLDDLVSADISMTEGDFCFECDLNFGSKKYWDACDPEINFGSLVIKVIIGTTTYQFLCEERDTTVTDKEIAFRVWGRSKQALLDKPYCRSISDTEETGVARDADSHPWQWKYSYRLSEVVSALQKYDEYDVDININIYDFFMYIGDMSLDYNTIIEALTNVIEVIGAVFVPEIDGSLSIEYFNHDSDTSVTSYDDFTDMVQLSETMDFPSGFNAVVVNGWTPSEGNDDDEEEEVTPISIDSDLTAFRTTEGDLYPNNSFPVDVVYYHSGGLLPLCSNPYGDSVLGSYEEVETTETIEFTFGEGQATYPDKNGKQTYVLKGGETVPFQYRDITYTYQVAHWYLTGYEVGEGYKAMFYFLDRSAYDVVNFDIIAVEEVPPEDPVYVDYTLEVLNRCDGEPVEGATVFFDEVYKGLTNEEGKISIGELLVGSTHSVDVTKPGIIRDAHVEEFTIPSP